MSYAEPYFRPGRTKRSYEIDELDEVALLERSYFNGREYEGGIRGIVVAVWDEGNAFDVEFQGHDTLTFVYKNQIGLVRTAD